LGESDLEAARFVGGHVKVVLSALEGDGRAVGVDIEMGGGSRWS
jgi:hypothetical protein